MKILIIILLIIAFLVLGFFVSFPIVTKTLFNKLFTRVSDDYIEKSFKEDKEYDGVREEILSCKKQLELLPHEDLFTYNDNLKLHAVLYKNNTEKLAVLMHGIHSSPYYNFSYIATKLYSLGYSILLVDQRSHGLSEGKYITFGILEQYDLLAWLDLIDKNLENIQEIIVYGISMGASTVGYASNKIHSDKVKALILDCGFTSFENMMKYNLKRTHTKDLGFSNYYRRTAKKLLGVNIKDNEVKNSLKNSKIKTLFIHGELDDVVPLSHTLKNYEETTSEKDLIIIKNAKHTTSSIIGKEDFWKKFFEFIN